MGQQKLNIGVMGSPELKKELERQAKTEGRSTSNLCERLLIWSLEQLKTAGDSNALVKLGPGAGEVPRYSPRVSHATQDEVQTALRMIFEHAPSPVIEKVVEFISERAARYEDENNARR